MLKRPVAAADVRPGEPGGAGESSTLSVLKEELFSLETERLQGKISDAEYAEHKAALEQVLRRVLNRTGESATAKVGAIAPDLAARSGFKS